MGEALDRADRGGSLNTRELLRIADLLTLRGDPESPLLGLGADGRAGQQLQHPGQLQGAEGFFKQLSALHKPPALVKPAFELRLLCLAGYEPLADACALCGREDPAAGPPGR